MFLFYYILFYYISIGTHIFRERQEGMRSTPFLLLVQTCFNEFEPAVVTVEPEQVKRKIMSNYGI